MQTAEKMEGCEKLGRYDGSDEGSEGKFWFTFEEMPHVASAAF